jgi:hypothetical protein
MITSKLTCSRHDQQSPNHHHGVSLMLSLAGRRDLQGVACGTISVAVATLYPLK